MQFGWCIPKSIMHPKHNTGQMESLQKGIAIADAALNTFRPDLRQGTKRHAVDWQVASAPFELPAGLHFCPAHLCFEACTAFAPVTIATGQLSGSVSLLK